MALLTVRGAGVVAVMALLTACQTPATGAEGTGVGLAGNGAVRDTAPRKTVGLIGHRGARGLVPENTLASFAKALSVGVSGVEFDVGVTRDDVVVVYHDRRLGSDITRDATGQWLTGEGPFLRDLTLAELETYDVGRLEPGSKYAKRFSEQRPVDGARIPTLQALLALIEQSGNRELRLDIEIKSNPEEPEVTLDPARFAEAVIAVVRRSGIQAQTTILSFDWRVLAQVQKTAPDIPTVYLTAEQRWLDNIQRDAAQPSPWTAGLAIDDFDGSVPRMIKAAGGGIWSAHHKDLDRSALEEAHGLGLEVMVWTVNEPRQMRRLIDLGVDGIVTDYPDRLRTVLVKKGHVVPAVMHVTVP